MLDFLLIIERKYISLSASCLRSFLRLSVAVAAVWLEVRAVGRLAGRLVVHRTLSSRSYLCRVIRKNSCDSYGGALVGRLVARRSRLFWHYYSACFNSMPGRI